MMWERVRNRVGVRAKVRVRVRVGVGAGVRVGVWLDLSCLVKDRGLVRVARCSITHVDGPVLFVSLSNLCGLTYSLFLMLHRDSALAESRQGLIDKFCAAVPLVLVVIAYLFDSDENMDSRVDNGILNVARHSCRRHVDAFIYYWLYIYQGFLYSSLMFILIIIFAAISLHLTSLHIYFCFVLPWP